MFEYKVTYVEADGVSHEVSFNDVEQAIAHYQAAANLGLRPTMMCRETSEWFHVPEKDLRWGH